MKFYKNVKRKVETGGVWCGLVALLIPAKAPSINTAFLSKTRFTGAAARAASPLKLNFSMRLYLSYLQHSSVFFSIVM